MNMRCVYFLICISKSIELRPTVSRNSVSEASDAGNERLAEYKPDISPDEAPVVRELFDRWGRNRSPNSVFKLKPTRFLQTRKSRQKRSSEAPDFLNSLNNGLSKGREINGPSRTKFRRDSKQNGSNFTNRFLNRVYGNDSYHDDMNYGAKGTALPKVDYRSWKKDIKMRASQVQHLWEQLFHQQQDQHESRAGLQFRKSAHHSGLLNVSAQQTSPTENFNLDNDGLFSEYHPDLEDRGRDHKKHKKFIKYHLNKSRRNYYTTKGHKKKRRKGYKRMRVGKNSSTKFASLKKAEVDLKRVINNHHRKRTGESILNLGHRFNEFGQSGNGKRGSSRRGKFKSGFKNPNQKHVQKSSVDQQFQDSDSHFLFKNNRKEMGKDFHAKIEKEEKPDMWGKPDRDKTARGKDKNMFGSPHTRDYDPEIQEDQSRTRMTREEYLDFWNKYRRQKRMLEADPRAIQFRSELHKSREEKKNEEGIMGTLRRVARSIFSPAESILGSYISVLNKTRNWLTNTDPDKVTYVKHVIPYDLLYKQYTLYYNCLRVKKQYHIDNLGLPMNNIEALLVQSLDKLTLECHTW